VSGIQLRRCNNGPMALKLSIIAIAWALAILDVLAPEQFTYKNPLPFGPEEVSAPW